MAADTQYLVHFIGPKRLQILTETLGGLRIFFNVHACGVELSDSIGHFGLALLFFFWVSPLFIYTSEHNFWDSFLPKGGSQAKLTFTKWKH